MGIDDRETNKYFKNNKVFKARGSNVKIKKHRMGHTITWGV